MNRNKIILGTLFLIAAALSFLYYADKNRFGINGLLAPVTVNIETDKSYADDYRIVVEPGNRFFDTVSASVTQNSLKNTVVYAEIKNEYIQELFIRCTDTQNAASPIDNITVFVGNKTYYFSKDTIGTWKPHETEDGILFQLPIEPYAKSLIKPWINWYGDLNYGLKEITAFLSNPFSFWPTAVFILLFISLLWREIKTAACFITGKHNRCFEIIAVLLLVIFAFLLRADGFIRHSSWGDELYSSTVAANPNLPFINTFQDPGNPPLFFVLLRVWHLVFGWSEASGRMLCVVIGTLGVASFYGIVKAVSGRKCAFFAAFLLAVNISHIRYSNQIRSYILLMTLMTLAAYLFFRLVRKESVKNYTLYVFAGAALVNTHYYGVLLVVFNAVFYVAFNRKRLFLKKTFCFIAANVVIALSLLPFFIITAFQKALLNSGFNAGIPSPDKKDSVIFVILCLSCYLFFQVKQKSKAIKSLSAQSSGFFDYILYAGAFIFISAYIISLKRPILIWRYLSSLLPFLIMLFSLGVSYSKLGPVIRMGFVMALIPFSISFTAFGGGAYDVPQEILEYIDADVQTHSLKAAELNIRNSSYYGFAKIDAYSDTKDCDVVYVRYSDKSELRRLLSAAGLDEKNVLEIRIDNENYIGKKYISPKADD